MPLQSPETTDNSKKAAALKSQIGDTGIPTEELVRITEGTGILLVGRVLERVLQFLYAVVMARMLGYERFGLFMLGVTIFSLASVFGRFGLDCGVLKYVALYDGINDKERVKGVIIASLKFAFLISVIVGMVLFLTSEYLASAIFKKSELKKIIEALSVCLPFLSLLTIAVSATRGFQVMRYTTYSQGIFRPIVNLVLAIVLLFLGFGLQGATSAYVISVLLTSILALYFLLKTFPEMVCIEAIPETKKLFRVSVPMFLTLFVTFLTMWTDTLMLGYFRSSGEVGVYNAAMRTAMLIAMVQISFSSVFTPMISDLHNRRELRKLKSLFQTTTRWIYTASLPMFLLMLLLSKEILVIFGREFMGGSICLLILALAQLVGASVGSAGMILAMSGKQDLMMYDTLLFCGLNILLNYIFIPFFGIVGAAIASGASITVYSIILLLQVHMLLKMYPYNRKFVSTTLYGVVSFGLVYMAKSFTVHMAEIPKVLVLVTLLIVIFAGLIYKWGGYDEDRLVINVFRENFRRAFA